MPTPEAYSRNDWQPPRHVQGIFEERDSGVAQLQGMGSVGCSAQEAREARALTCGMISMIDDAIGRVDAAVAECADENSVVRVFTSDHGDHLGDHRLLFKGAEQYEQLTRVPFIWADPQGPSGEHSGALGQTLDIGRTILERAKVEPAVGMEGIVLPPIGDSDRESAFIQYEHQKVNPGIGPQPRIYTIRYGNWRFSLIHGIEEGELYNLSEDPGEFHNLWSEPSAQTVKAQMMERLARAHMDAVIRAPLPARKA
jgi:arylsulfatase A-like enzyme